MTAVEQLTPALGTVENPLLLSNSSINDYLNCRRFYRISRIQRIDKKLRGTALYIGSAFHKFKEGIYSGLHVKNALASMHESFAECPTALMDGEQISKWEIEKSRITSIAEAWAALFLEADIAQYSEFRVEEHIEMELFPGCKYHGYIDCLVEDREGNWWVLETKTASVSTISEDYFGRLSFDSQVLGYMHLARKLLGKWPAGVIYDVACKTTHRKLISKGETTQQFCRRIKEMYMDPAERDRLFHRRTILIGSKDLSEWLVNTSYAANEIHKKYVDGEDQPGGVWIRNTSQCLGKYGACKYLSICQKGHIDPNMYEVREPYVRR